MSESTLFTRFSEKHIVVIGDLMLDKYLYGRVDRISPEAPVPILHLQQAEYRLGGAGNVARNLAALGARVSIFAAVGEDENANVLCDKLQEQKIDCEGIMHLENYRTTVKTRLLGGTQQLLRVDDEEYRELTSGEMTRFLKDLEAFIEKQEPDGIILQDYNKGLLSADLIGGILDLAKKNDVKVAVDPKFANFLAYQSVFLFKPNLRELEAALPFRLETTMDGLKRATSYLREKLNAGSFCITLSERGIYLDNGKSTILAPAQARRVVDVCGAGDAVISVLFLAALSGAGPEEMGRIANLAGGQVCGKVGVAPVDKSELQAEYEKQGGI